MSASGYTNALEFKQIELRNAQYNLLLMTAKYDTNLETLNEYQKYQEKWTTAEENCLAQDKEYKVGSTIFVKKSGSGDSVTYTPANGWSIEEAAKRYATKKVRHDFSDSTTKDSLIYEELNEKDIQFDTLKTTFQAMCDQLNAEVDALKENASTECGKTYLLGGS